MKRIVTGAILAAGLVLNTLPSFGQELEIEGVWERIFSGTSRNLNDVYGDASNTVAVGAYGTYLHFDGNEWVRLQVPDMMELHAVWRALDGTVYAVGDRGTVVRVNGDVAVREISGTWVNLTGVWIDHRGEVYACGDKGTVMHRRSDTSWARELTYTSRNLNDIHGHPTTGVFAVGDYGTIVSLDAEGNWSVMPTPVTRNLQAVWVGEDYALAVGDNGTILRLEEGEWVLKFTPTTRVLRGAWIEGENRAFATGDWGMILFFDGVDWKQMNSGTSENLKSIYSGYAVGNAGVVLRNVNFFAEVGGMRMTEVLPSENRVELTNTGGAFVSPALPLSYDNDRAATPGGEVLEVGEINVYQVPGLDRNDSDLWLHRSDPLNDPDNLVHGVKYGPKHDVGFTGVAVAANRWPAVDAFAAAPPSGMSLAWDGFGFGPLDWYVDETPTLGRPDFTEPRTVANELLVPAGVQDLDNAQLGDEVFALAGWGYENDSPAGVFTARIVGDVNGDPTPHDGSERWMRVRDQDPRDVANVMHTADVDRTLWDAYEWGFDINIEAALANGASPGIMVQHDAPGGFRNVWGVRFDTEGAWLVTTSDAGVARRTQIYGYAAGTMPGQWVKFRLAGNTSAGTVAVDAGGFAVSLPVTSEIATDRGRIRLVYDGSGVSNTGTMLLDNVGVALSGAVPIALTELQGAMGAGGVALRWDVYTTVPLEGFYVTRRVGDGAVERLGAMLPPDARTFTDAGAPQEATLRYVVTAVSTDGTETSSREFVLAPEREWPLTGAAPPPISLSYGAPNPFFRSTSVTMSIPQGGEATLAVYDVRGRLVRRLAAGTQSPGDHVVTWDGRDRNGRLVPAGTYFIRMDASGEAFTRKVVLIR
jgi:hypothetical protein